MAQTASKPISSGRAAALARRRAQSSAGKAATAGVTSAVEKAPPRTASPAAAGSSRQPRSAVPVGRAASRARREAMSSRGRAAITSRDRVRSLASSRPASESAAPATETAQPSKEHRCDCGCGGKKEKAVAATNGVEQWAKSAKGTGRSMLRKPLAKSGGRAASLARRQALSSRGKAGVNANGMTPAQAARAANPQLSGRELAQALRAQRSRNGNAGQRKTEPTGRRRPERPGAAQDAPWKVGVSETGQGQSVTGTMVGRSQRVTGDEPSTCRTVTGTEYMGADIFRTFCQSEPQKAPRKVGLSPTGRGNRVTGNEVGRSGKVTGDEPGTCKRVTGTEYVGANQTQAFCGTPAEPGAAKVTVAETRKGKNVTGNNVGRSAKVTGDEPGAGRELTGTQYMQSGNGSAPPKVGLSATLRGGSITGTRVGRSARVTGDEPGGCRDITGDDYVGQEQYREFCPSTPAPQDEKVGQSQTLAGKAVTGTMTGRSSRVTGDEPGTCKSVTGTPYAGAEQYRSYCQPEDQSMASARSAPRRATPGSVMTGQQPGIGGKMTGAEKGACEPLTGTPYVGADQFAQACPATPAEPGSPDFPQPLGTMPWGQFSVASPSHAAQADGQPGAVTGTRYEKGHITGPFGKAGNKITGTEEFRFGQSGNGSTRGETTPPATTEQVDGRVKSRITGEGMDAGPKITGDDWDRGDRITGTEGTSAVRRNPTRRGGPMSAMAAPQLDKRNETLPEPVSKVTGGSGNTERGALITYSGGARG